MMEFGGTSVAGPRPYNEDTFLFKDLSAFKQNLGGLRAFIMVSDGMGGHQSGDVASRAARETAESYLNDLLGMAAKDVLSVEPAIALKEIVSEAHAAVLAAAQAEGGASMGATFVGAFIGDGRAWVGHVGDSRAYRFHRGEATQLTTDHSQVGRLIAEGVLTEEQAQHHPSRNVIERALGFSGAEAEVDIIDLEFEDALLLCSDGLSTVLSGADMVALASGARNAQDATKALTAGAEAAGTDDNTTAVLWVDDWHAFVRSSPHEQGRKKAATIERRAAARHSNAQKASWLVAGVVALAGVGLLATALLSGHSAAGGGGGVVPPSSSSATGTAPSQTSPTLPGGQEGGEKGARPGQGQGLIALRVVGTDTWLRSKKSHSTGDHVRRFRPGSLVYASGHVRGYYLFEAASIVPGWLLDDNHKPLKVFSSSQTELYSIDSTENFAPQ